MIRSSRRTLLAVALVGTLPAVALSTASHATTAPGGDGAVLLPPAEGVTEYPLTLETWAGETVLEARPERVAVLDFSSNYDALEAIGVVPVYVRYNEGWAWNDPDFLARAEFVDDSPRGDINFEAVAASDPDLIVAINYVWSEEDFAKLAAVAPVLELSEEQRGAFVDWRDNQRLVGEVLDLPGAADAAIAAADEQIAAVAAANPQFAGKTITIGYDYPSSAIAYYTATGSTSESVVTDLGFVPNPTGEQFVESDEVADENVGLLDADVLIVFYDTAAERDDRESQALFQAIPVVADGRYVGIVLQDESGDYTPESSATWVLRRGQSTLSVPWVLELLADWAGSVDLN